MKGGLMQAASQKQAGVPVALSVSSTCRYPTDVALSILDRLWRRTKVTPDGCWVFMGYRKSNYGALSVYNRAEYAHRLSVEIHRGPIPPGLRALHHCDNPPCWNPDHLFLGTQLDNVRDMEAKGRARKVPPPGGERHHKATCGDDIVEGVRRSTAPQRELAADLGVSQSTIWRWRHGEVR